MGLSLTEPSNPALVCRPLQAFQNDPPTTIFLLNAQTATVGINLTAANYILLVWICSITVRVWGEESG